MAGYATPHLKAIREMKEFSVEDLARKAKVDVNALQTWETNGRVPTRQALRKLATALNVQQYTLLNPTMPPQPLRITTCKLEPQVYLPGLAWARQQAGLSRLQLANKASIATTTLARWEQQAHSAPLSAVTRLAEVLNVTPEMLTGTPPAQPILSECLSLLCFVNQFEERLQSLRSFYLTLRHLDDCVTKLEDYLTAPSKQIAQPAQSTQTLNTY